MRTQKIINVNGVQIMLSVRLKKNVRTRLGTHDVYIFNKYRLKNGGWENVGYAARPNKTKALGWLREICCNLGIQSDSLSDMASVIEDWE